MTSLSKPILAREQTPAAQAMSAWLRTLARALKTFRMYRADNEVVIQLRGEIVAGLQETIEKYGALELNFTPSEILVGSEPVIRAASAEGSRGPEDRLAFQFYRDGIRRLTFVPGVPEREILMLLEALKATGGGPETQDDLVTLLWQGNLAGIVVESVPLEQTIYVSSAPGSQTGPGGPPTAQTYAQSPKGEVIRAEIGQAAGAQGLHRDTFDDWELPAESADVAEAWARLSRATDAARASLAERWAEENATDWTRQAPAVLRRLIALDPSDDMRAALIQAAVTWLAAAIQRAGWEEAQLAIGTLRELDPDRTLTEEPLAAALAGLDADEITAQLDDRDSEDLSRFTAVVVEIGPPAIALTCAALARAEQIRARAAATTALCYQCGSDPETLRPYLADSRWTLVRNLVFVLGQIGGPEVVPLLKLVADHPEVQVRRQVVQSLGSVPPESRMPILIQQLDTRDPRLLAATLSMMTREKGARTSRAILDRIEAPDFPSRTEDNQRALFGALAEVAEDEAVPALETMLHKGGWFARHTLERVAAARTLRRIGTEKAMAVLEAGLRARSEAVRTACLDAMSAKAAA